MDEQKKYTCRIDKPFAPFGRLILANTHKDAAEQYVRDLYKYQEITDKDNPVLVLVSDDERQEEPFQVFITLEVCARSNKPWKYPVLTAEEAKAQGEVLPDDEA